MKIIGYNFSIIEINVNLPTAIDLLLYICSEIFTREQGEVVDLQVHILCI